MDGFNELYSNLSPIKLSMENVAQWETRVEKLKQEVKQLEIALNKSELAKRNCERDRKNVLKNQENLLVNISALFKTAKREIERKNNTTRELRQQLDDFIFRRHQSQLLFQNEVVQSRNVDDVKSVAENLHPASAIRPMVRNDVFRDREKSLIGHKSSLPARINSSRPYTNVEKDNRSDSSRVFVENSAASRKVREIDYRELGICEKADERLRFAPYENHERSYKQRPRERDQNDEESLKNRAKRSPHRDGQIEALDILAQYGVYATPHKQLIGDKRNSSAFKLVSPIADTPDHLKALFNDSKVKVRPIPMLNERRVLDEFDSLAEKHVIPTKAAKKDFTVSRNSNEEPSKLRVIGTDSTIAEHGVFVRKRRIPVIRRV